MAAAGAGRIAFLDYLRALAAWLVVWDHFNGRIVDLTGGPWEPASLVDRYLAKPLGIVQNFGWFAVCLFFLISGFIITHVATTEAAPTFALRRGLRIFPMLAVAVAWALTETPQFRSQATPITILTNVTTLNYLFAPQVIFVGVAWSLVIEVVFYALTLLLYPLSRSPHENVACLAICFAAVRYASSFGDDFFLLAVVLGHVPILVAGQVFYWWLWRHRLRPALAMGYLALCAATWSYAELTLHPERFTDYFPSVAFAGVAFVLLLRIPVRTSRAIRFLADTSYSTYLLHAYVGFLALNLLIPTVPTILALVVAVAATLAASSITYALIEKPFMRLARGRIGLVPEPTAVFVTSDHKGPRLGG